MGKDQNERGYRPEKEDREYNKFCSEFFEELTFDDVTLYNYWTEHKRLVDKDANRKLNDIPLSHLGHI